MQVREIEIEIVTMVIRRVLGDLESVIRVFEPARSHAVEI